VTVELSWLRTWVQVVESGGFARAAEAIHLSQPRVSVHIANLERELNVSLIERRTRPLTLTSDGERLLNKARSVLLAAEELSTEAALLRGEISGRLRVASFSSASAVFLPPVVARLEREHPLIEIGILDGDVDQIEMALTERRVMVALRPLWPEPHDRNLEARPLWRESFVVLAPTGHPLLARQTVVPDELRDHRVITIGDPLSSSAIGHEAEGLLASVGISTSSGIVSHQPTTLAAMVRAGLGVGLVNQLATLIVPMDGLEVRSITGLQRWRDVGVWWHRDRPLSPAAHEFIRSIRSEPVPQVATPLPEPDPARHTPARSR
jgi:LysR family transcriptional regulator, hydrogen peroxide-inducible genes activator